MFRHSAGVSAFLRLITNKAVGKASIEPQNTLDDIICRVMSIGLSDRAVSKASWYVSMYESIPGILLWASVSIMVSQVPSMYPWSMNRK